MKLSVIIPIYNTIDYLERCILSVIQQTYQDMEIILIDDGSTDGSAEVVDDFAQQDSRIVSVHQTNHGESAARNRGLELATGEYIAFVDCDDWIELDMYGSMLAEAEEWSLDIVAAGWYQATDTGDIVISNKEAVDADVFSGDRFLSYLYRRDSYRGFAYMWNKLYKSALLKPNHGKRIYFDERLRLGGDVVFLAETAIRAQRIKYIDKPYYHYYQRENSGCHTRDLAKMRDWVMAYELVLDLFCAENVSDDVIGYVKRFMAYHSSNAVEMAKAQGDMQWARQFQQTMQKYKKEYMELNREYPERTERFERLLRDDGGDT